MKKFGTIAIVGTGLIGGSLGLAVRRRGLASRVIGISRTPQSIATAGKIGAIDEGSTGLEAITGADLIVLCLPVGEILRQAPRVVELASETSVICDAGSTKEEITRTFGRLTDRFVGCHPMAGSEKRGVAHASAGLFDGSLCIITPAKGTDRKALATARGFWSAVCGKIATMTPAEHDRIMASVSHLAHATAFALVNSVPARLLEYAAGGFRDTTRLAASDEKIWEDIFFTNKRNLARELGALEKNLRLMRGAIERGDAAKLRKFLAAAKNARQRLNK